jgi:hypothetical protein
MPHFLLQVGKQALTTAAYAAFVSAIAACSGPSSVAYSPTSFTGANVPNGIHRATAYSFKTLDNPDDPAFNELLAINNLGKVGGYYGNGSKKNQALATSYETSETHITGRSAIRERPTRSSPPLII